MGGSEEAWADLYREGVHNPEDLRSLLAIAYLSGRAEMMQQIMDGFHLRERPGVTFARLAEMDAGMARMFGLGPLWGGLTIEQAKNAPVPTVADAVRLRDEVFGDRP